MEYSYFLIDAFTSEVFQGAPIAVFLNAAGLSDSKMQLIARELNQTESVFMLPGDKKHARELRIFTPETELDFGGHPVIAASYVLYKNKEITKGEYKLKLPIGTVTIDITDDVRFQFSIAAETKLDDFVPSAKELGEILHLDESEIDLSHHKAMISGYGEEYLIVPVRSEAQLNKAVFNEEKWTMSFVATLANKILLFCENKDDMSIDYNARLFGKGISSKEDPPIGSSVPAFGNYIFSGSSNGVNTAIIQRGGGERRVSTISVEVHKSQSHVSKIKVGGCSVVVGEGKIYCD